jgi:hypothetical protein
VSEIARVLKPGGRCLATYFLLNAESEQLVMAGRSTLDFKYDIGGCSTTHRTAPDAAVAYDEMHVTGLYEKYGLSIVNPIHYGSWCNRPVFLSYQDLVVAEKNAPAVGFA